MTEEQQEQIIDQIAAGFGVEDIALALKLPVADVRAFVNQLRDEGLLDALFEGDE
jgi:DNA-binding NarL/FixJ family response regulator